MPAAGSNKDPSPPTATISGRVWWDVDADGVRGDDEPGVPDVAVALWTDGGGAPDTRITATTTAADGTYVLVLPDPSLEYVVEFVTSDHLTRRDAGTDDTRDSDADPDTRLTGPIPATGVSAPTVDAGLVRPIVVEDPPAALSGRVWEDEDQDGLQDDDEPGVPDVTVTLRTDDGGDGGPGTEVDSTMTDADGRYRFDGLAPGGGYLVHFAEPSGYTFTTPNVGGDETIDSDPDQATGTASVPPLDFAEVGVIDAGLAIPGGPTDVDPPPPPTAVAPIAGHVWTDDDGDGIRDADEPRAVADVDLWTDDDGDGAPDTQVATTTTDDDGRYLFDGLDQSLRYVVAFDVPGPLTTKDVGSDDTVDSDPDPGTGTTDVIAFDGATATTNVDAGVLGPVVHPAATWIGGRVWLDEDGDGIQVEGEPDVPGINIDLWTDDDGDGRPDTTVARTTSGDDGRYLFDRLDPSRRYIVQFETERFFTVQDAGGDDRLDSDADPFSGLTDPIELVDPRAFDPTTIDAGLVRVPVPVAALPAMGAGVGSTLTLAVGMLALGLVLLSGHRRRRGGPDAA